MCVHTHTYTHTHYLEMNEHGHLRKKNNSGFEANVYVLIEESDHGN